MVVSLFRVRDPRKRDLIARLADNAGFLALKEEVLRARDEYFVNLAKGLASTRTAVDQREIDEKRGFWAGAVWALDRFPTMTKRDWDKMVAQANEESEDS